MNRLALLVIATLIAIGASARQKTTKKVAPRPESSLVVATADTVVAAEIPHGRYVIAGYDKRLRATRESIFITNHSADSLMALNLEIVYTDLSGRRLHKTERWVNCFLAPGETANFTIPTWDRQGSFYYRRSQAPSRSQGTPFDVTIKILNAVVPLGSHTYEDP